jgi:hypothetical protein
VVTPSQVQAAYEDFGQVMPASSVSIAYDFNAAVAGHPETYQGFLDGSQTLWICGWARRVADIGWEPLAALIG